MSFCTRSKSKFLLKKKQNNEKCNSIQAQKQGLRGLGPKESEKNERHFSAETINQGNTVISTQYGYNKGATQSGIIFGNTRHM